MSDGNFKWWHADSDDAELWNGPHDTRDEAIADGSEYHDGEPFWICEADKMAIRVEGIFDGDDLTDLIENPDLLTWEWASEHFDRSNEYCFGEDGPQHLDASPEQQADLLLSLRAALAMPEKQHEAMSAAFEKWAMAHPDTLPEAWTFGTVRNTECIGAQA